MALVVTTVQHGVVRTIEHRVDLPSEVRRPQGPILPLLRAAATNRVAADALLAVFVDQVAPALSVAPDHAAGRASPSLAISSLFRRWPAWTTPN